MVVLAASIVSKSGKVLVSRQFVDLTRIRIEGLLAAFPKLVGIGKQHTFVEVENVRYVYQPMDALYLLLVPEYCPAVDVEGICQSGFELIIFAFDEVICLGHKETVIISQVEQYREMESHEENLHKLLRQSKIDDTKDVMKRKASEIDQRNLRGAGGLGSMKSISSKIEIIFEDVKQSGVVSKSAAPLPTDFITLNIEKKLNVLLKREGGVSNFDVQGTVMLQVLNQEDGLIQAQSGTNSAIHFKTHPNINKELFSNENILGLKDPNRPFPTCPPGDAGVSLLRWRMLSTDKSLVPLTSDNFFFWYVLLIYVVFAINCWPCVCGGDNYVSIEHEASSTMFDFHNLVISVPLPALRDAPNVSQVDGDWRIPTSQLLETSVVLFFFLDV
ncbi:hypothetical protein MKW98_014482, partial [Papaver atlanticum]